MRPLANMTTKVLKLEDILKKTKKSGDNKSDEDSQLNGSKNGKKDSKESILNIPKGVPVSGRVWKTPKKKFSSVIKSRGYKAANKFEKLLSVKQEVNRMRDISRSIVEAKKRQIEEKKERRRKNIEKKEANRLRAEIVQVIKNPAKIKRMRKKQLRNIEKRDTLVVKK